MHAPLADGRVVRMAGGSALRWLPLVLLALFAGVEAAAQCLFTATRCSEALHIPEAVLRFLEVGLLYKTCLGTACRSLHTRIVNASTSLQVLCASHRPRCECRNGTVDSMSWYFWWVCACLVAEIREAL